MKTSELKNLMKEAIKEVLLEGGIKKLVKEALHDEMKDLLLEAIKGNPNKTMIKENKTHLTPTFTKTSISDIMDETVMSLNTNNLNQPFNPMGSVSTLAEGSALPAGELSLEQIMNLGKK